MRGIGEAAVKLLSLLHRWTGSFVGLLLALLGLTGAILVWEGEWIMLPGAGDPVIEDVAAIAAITERAQTEGHLSRITFASDEIGLHQLVFADGSGAYVRQDGTVVARWASQWERPELWLFDLHHHLFAGEMGETVTGIAGIAGLLFVVTGLLLWWRTRRKFELRLLPEQFWPGPIVRHHRDLGASAAPLLAVTMLTGIVMLFAPLRTALIGPEVRPKEELETPAGFGAAEALALAKMRFPEASIRRITLPAKPGDPIAVRMRQPFEWTPNGRTQVSITEDGKATIEDAATANDSAWLSEKAYPVHSAKVGGLVWKFAATLSGVALSILGSLATWSFWSRHIRKARRASRGSRPARLAEHQLG